MFVQLVENGMPVVLNTNGIVLISVKESTDPSSGTTYFKRAEVKMWAGDIIVLDEENYNILIQVLIPQES